MVNAIAPIITNPNGAVVRSIYYLFLLHPEAALDEAVGSGVTAPSVAAPLEREIDRWSYEISALFAYYTQRQRATGTASMYP
jgi:hypothetical protein